MNNIAQSLLKLFEPKAAYANPPGPYEDSYGGKYRVITMPRDPSMEFERGPDIDRNNIRSFGATLPNNSPQGQAGAAYQQLIEKALSGVKGINGQSGYQNLLEGWGDAGIAGAKMIPGQMGQDLTQWLGRTQPGAEPAEGDLDYIPYDYLPSNVQRTREQNMETPEMFGTGENPNLGFQTISEYSDAGTGGRPRWGMTTPKSYGDALNFPASWEEALMKVLGKEVGVPKVKSQPQENTRDINWPLEYTDNPNVLMDEARFTRHNPGRLKEYKKQVEQEKLKEKYLQEQIKASQE